MDTSPTIVEEKVTTVTPITPVTPREWRLAENESQPVVTQVFLQPIAAPMILGLLSLASATFLVGALWAGLYGATPTLAFLIPFVAVFGGLTQLLSSMWSFRARDGLATILHGLWGSSWLAFGILYYLVARGFVPAPAAAASELGFWFVALAAISWVVTVASAARNTSLVVTVGLLSLSATLAAISYFIGSTGLLVVAGWVMLIGGLAAFYTGSALLFQGSFGREVLPLGRAPELVTERHIDSALNEPGVISH